MTRRNVPPSPRFLIVLVVAYALLLGAAIAWSALRGDHPILAGSARTAWPIWRSTLAGVAIGALVIFLSRLSVTCFQWARRLELEFARILGPLTGWSVVLMAVTSSVAEEAFFRGAMQPSWGLVITSLLFGILHLGPSRAFLPWTAMALTMGFVLGALFLWTGSLLAPVLCHGFINLVNLRRISLRALEEAAPAPAVDPDECHTA